jgi:N-acetyl-gamma-glutamyl-phosphate reductase
MTLASFDPDLVAQTSELVFLALPHGASQSAAHELRLRGVKVVDLSADHRFDDPSEYERVYGAPHTYPDRLREAIYGLPELRRAELLNSDFVACPGCYPTSVTLAVIPMIEAGLLADLEVIADCKSGVSGAGRGASVSSLFSERGETIQGYKTLAHRHAPEIEMNLNRVFRMNSDTQNNEALGDQRCCVHFAPHLVPMSRGILSTVYLRPHTSVQEDELRALYEERYRDEEFVHVLPQGQHPTTLAVRGSNHCHLGLTVTPRLVVVHSAIDNLGKGAASQAIQCSNLMLGFAEGLGVSHIGVYP